MKISAGRIKEIIREEYSRWSVSREKLDADAGEVPVSVSVDTDGMTMINFGSSYTLGLDVTNLKKLIDMLDGAVETNIKRAGHEG